MWPRPPGPVQNLPCIPRPGRNGRCLSNSRTVEDFKRHTGGIFLAEEAPKRSARLPRRGRLARNDTLQAVRCSRIIRNSSIPDTRNRHKADLLPAGCRMTRLCQLSSLSLILSFSATHSIPNSH